MRRILIIGLLSTSAAACGGAAPSTSLPNAGGENAESGLPSLDTSSVSIEAESEVRVIFARMSLPAGDSFVAPVSECQDVLVLVREGEAEMLGAEPAIRLGVDDAYRFGPEAGHGLRNASTESVELVVAFTRATGFGFAGQDLETVGQSLQQPPEDQRCVRPVSDSSLPRLARGSEVPVLQVAGGRLRVRILLDAERNGARFGGLSLLEADADFSVPVHAHPGANEALVIERGAGVMSIGQDSFSVRDGSILFVPDNVMHGLEAEGSREMRAIQVYAPSGAEQRFRRLAESTTP